MSVSLRPLRADDMALLHHWHMQPHLRPHYMRANISADEIARKFMARLDPTHTVRCRIAETNGAPYGFIQWYPSWHWPECGAMRAGITNSCSGDYFIGEPAMLGKGLAAAMLRETAREVFAVMLPGQRTFCIAHDVRNERAIRATLAAGFSREAETSDDGAPNTVYVLRAA